MKRIIPTTMVSQHPDHANVPFWHDREFIRTNYEPREAYFMFAELGVDEYKWDWEGKLVDESVMERLLSDYYDYFQKHPIGHEKFITFRLPNPKVDTEFRVGRAFMTLLSSSVLANHFKLPAKPLFEVIVPMTETAEELIEIKEAFEEVASLKHPLYRFTKDTIKYIQIIPLFEEVDTIINSDAILKTYITKHQKAFGAAPHYVRPYIARSDPALNSGMVATVLATKIALSRYKDLAQETGIPLYPIIGSASLPFRGGLTPYSVEAFAEEFHGIRTALLQSAFRYDYPKADVIKAVKQLQTLLPKAQPRSIPSADQTELIAIIPAFEQAYRETVEKIADTINHIASQLPRRRERVQHIGLFGYSRGVGGVKLPRAIGFTAALYSLGVPPEFIGTGRGLRQVRELGKLDLLESYYLNLKSDLKRAGKYINHQVLDKLAASDPAWSAIKEDITEVEAYLGVTLEAESDEELEHHKLTSQIYEHLTDEGEQLTHLIESAARMRHSMG